MFSSIPIRFQSNSNQGSDEATAYVQLPHYPSIQQCFSLYVVHSYLLEAQKMPNYHANSKYMVAHGCQLLFDTYACQNSRLSQLTVCVHARSVHPRQTHLDLNVGTMCFKFIRCPLFLQTCILFFFGRTENDDSSVNITCVHVSSVWA